MHRTMKHMIPWLAVGLTACSAMNPPPDKSVLNKIDDQLKQAASPKAPQGGPVPESVSSSLLPPLRTTLTPKASSKQLEQRFDLVVNDAPINQVLMGLVSGTRYSLLLKPKTVTPTGSTATAAGNTGMAGILGGASAAPAAMTNAAGVNERVTLNLKDVTVFEALDAIRELYGYDYTLEGNRIYVQQPELQTRLYQVNYIAGQRRGVSDLQVIGGASVGTSSSSSSGSGSSSSSSSNSSYASVQASALTTIAKADLWGEVEDALRTTLGCAIPKNLPSRGGAGGSGSSSGGLGGTASGGSSSSGSSSSSGGASRADVSYPGDMQMGERVRGVDGCAEGRAMTINQMSGTILVRGMPRELRMVEQMLRSMQLNIARQVIIEAKIIDVELNAAAQQGINWAAFNSANQHRFSVGANAANISARPSTVTYPTSSSKVTTTAGTPGSTKVTSVTDSTTGGTTTTTEVTSGTAASSSLETTATSGINLAEGLVTGSLGSLLGGTTSIASGLGVAVQYQSFMAMLNFLQTQGTVHVLSSPRIATLNNQKAVIKVGSEEPFVTSIAAPTTTSSAAGITQAQASLIYQPFFSGIALDVTPQIDDKDNITLHVHSMVNSITEKSKIAQPTSSSQLVPFAVNTINETDSVVRTTDGQVIVIGGLMTESTVDSRNKVPGVGDAPAVGALFSNGAQSKVKRELVILLKPTVVKDEKTWASDIAGVQSRIAGMQPAPAADQ